MIDLTVKTLDSQNHAFSVDDDQITVRGFKEYIAESVAVPADSQRLIYCGRVLQDEKKLNDYDVNGKVIHLVQRAPPQPGQRGNDGGPAQGQDHGQGRQGQQRSQFRLTRTQTHANAMYMGTIPAEIVDGHVLSVPPLSNSLSNSRLLVARRMFNRCDEIIDRLDNPNAQPNTTSSTSESSQTLPQQVQVQEVETEAEDNGEGRGNFGARLAAAAAIAAVLHGADNVTVLRGRSDEGNEQRSDANSEETQSESQAGQQSQSEQQATASNSEGQANRRSSPRFPRTHEMAELLTRLLVTQNRLRPHIEHYRVLMLTDPALLPGADSSGVEENQRIVDGVSECLHYLSHACHALSDIIVDMGQQPPRNLRCRPIIIQHSAILQAGIPIQVEARISLYGRNGNNNNGNEETNDSAGAAAQSETTEPTEPVDVNVEGARQTDGESSNSAQTGEQQSHPDHTQTPFGTVFNLPNNVEVLMEVSPESNMETIPESEPSQNNESNNNNTNTANNNNAGRTGGNAAGVFPSSWGSGPPPPEFLRNLMQVVAGHMMQNIATTTITTRGTSTTAGQQATAASTESTNTTGGQSTVARSNVGTHPTTATQTRSTSRPHVFHQHTHPLSLGLHMNRVEVEFDPFLPCNSHHIRRTPSTTANTTTTTATTTTTTSQATRTSQQAPVQETQTQSQPAMSSTSSGSTTSSNTTSQTASQTATHNAFMNLIRVIAATAGPQTSININSNDPELAQNLSGLMQMFGGGNFHVGFLRDSHPATTITLAELIGNRSTGTDSHGPVREENFLNDVFSLLAQNMTVEGMIGFRLGRFEPLTRLRRPLREYFQRAFPSATSTETFQDQVTERFLSHLRPYLRNLLVPEEEACRTDSRVDICATIESLVNRHTRDILKTLFDNDAHDQTFGEQLFSMINNLERQLCAVLRYYIPGGQAEFETVASRFLSGMSQNVQSNILEWYTNECLERFRAYFLNSTQPPESEILPLLIYKDAPQQASAAPPVSSQVPQQTKPESEPMETEPAEETPPVVEAQMAEDSEEIPETFPGHEALPSDWVPIIARDGVRQRRQLQGMAAGGVTAFSDAYLGGLPSKRRKLIEQQKPRLLVSPTPNHSAISASMERLVREGVGRAGVEEVEGAAVAVAADPGVRRAFGQAIRDCLNPNRYGTPDFPDPLRFPNATKYFADQERPPK